MGRGAYAVMENMQTPKTTNVLPKKDEERQHPIPTAWRPAMCELVKAFVRRDYAAQAGIACVSPVPSTVADQISAYIAEYGETLVELPEQTWTTSVSQWMGTHWEVLVDLWTVESGPSDMVLSGRVYETSDAFLIEVGSVYVP